MESFLALMDGFATAITPINLMWSLIGVTLGTLIGILPGIGPALTIALLLPVTRNLDPTGAFIMFAGLYYGAMYGSSTTSILLNTPGESGSIMTAVEGNLMARQGRGAAALSTAAIGSFVAGTLGTLALTFLAPLFVKLALLFRPGGIFRAHGSGVHNGLRPARRFHQPRGCQPASGPGLRTCGHRHPHGPATPDVRLSKPAARHRYRGGGGWPVRGGRSAFHGVADAPAQRRKSCPSRARCS